MNEPRFFDVIANFRHWQVPEADVAACTRFVSSKTGEVIYLFTSEHPVIHPERPVVYIIRYEAAFQRVVCTCPEGIAGTCRHRRAATVLERLFNS